MSNRGISRGRMFMGGFLLLAALVTWVLGLTMSAQGESVARGTEYVRSTILIFKRNDAIGTLVLSAIAAWLLFPRRPRMPLRDGALIVLLLFLAGSSIYTLAGIARIGLPGAGVPENLAGGDMNSAWNESGPPDMTSANMTSVPEMNSSGLPLGGMATPPPAAIKSPGSTPREHAMDVGPAAEDAQGDAPPQPDEGDTANNETDGNQD